MFVHLLSFVKNKYQKILNKFKSKKIDKINLLLSENENLKNFILNSIPIFAETFDNINKELNKNAELNKEICKMFGVIEKKFINYQETINQHAEIINGLLAKYDTDMSNVYPFFLNNADKKN